MPNGASASTSALITAVNTGVLFRLAGGSVANFGTVTGIGFTGVYLQLGGKVTNGAKGVISGGVYGIEFLSGKGTVVNLGAVEATAGKGVRLMAGGSITNGQSGSTAGLVSGTAAGAYLEDLGGTVTNFGAIKGLIGFDGVGSGNNTLINFGTVASTSTVAGAVAVTMGNSLGTDLLVVEKGAVFVGQVEGGGRGEIEFAANGTAAMGTNISGFNTVALANGGLDSLTLTNANFFGVDGRKTVIGGNNGNIVNASEVTTGQLTIDGGAGKDVLTGSAGGGTIFVFTAAALTAADKIIGGGSFNNELEMTTAGTVAAGGVTGVEIYQLADGGTVANSLTLTDANFAGFMGNAITIYGGTGGKGNTIDGSRLTGAADGLVVYGGSGADTLKGGAGNDIFVFTAAALTSTDTVSGGTGTNELLMTTAGTVAAGGVSGVETYVLADGKANTLSLVSGNFTKVTGSVITISDGNNGNTVSVAATVPAADHIIVYAGTSIDKLTGGPGNDVFHAGGKTTMTGNGGANEFVFSAPGSNSITDFTASASNEMLFISGSGFSLPGATATLEPLGSLFIQNSTGAFTSTGQRFAYDTGNHDLYYDADGSAAGSSRALVTTLSDHPASLNASHLLFAT